MALSFTVPGKPVPKARARKGRGGHWFTPDATRRYELLCAIHATAARNQRNARARKPWPLDATYEVLVVCAWSDRRRRDADNVGKSVLDAGNRILWDDDAQVTKVTVERIVGADVEETRVVVRIREAA